MHAGVRTGTKQSLEDNSSGAEERMIPSENMPEHDDVTAKSVVAKHKNDRREKNKKKRQKTPDIQRSIWENFRLVNSA